MNHVRVTARVYTDNSGRYHEFPAILYEQNGKRALIEPLIAYFIAFYQARSLSWMKKVCQATEMLLDYMHANQSAFTNVESLFPTFAQRLFEGTIGTDGRDPSGLYWAGKKVKNARGLLIVLGDFSAWMHKNGYAKVILNPLTEASSYEQRLAWTAHINRSARSLLGHLDTREGVSKASRMAKTIKTRRAAVGESGAVKAFPDEMVRDLLFKGFLIPGATEKDDIVARYDWRGICITILLNYGGLRVSEPFHLWVGDVLPNTINSSSSDTVLVYHPTDGTVPDDFERIDGVPLPTREAYLAVRYPNYPPRTKGRGNYHSGWKNPRLDNANKGYMKVHWFPSDGGRLFMQAYTFYMLQRIRAKIVSKKHPFLFVSFRGEQHDEPYTIRAYTEALKRAVKRIGLPFGKEYGTTDHGHRHGYGQRQRRADTGEIITMRGLHHKSAASQKPYTDPSIEEVTQYLERASKAMAAGGSPLPMMDDLDALIKQDREEKLYRRRIK